LRDLRPLEQAENVPDAVLNDPGRGGRLPEVR
jgi:hypothetical protein